MKNRVELVNKELHYKFFQSIDPPQQKEQHQPQRHHNLSSQILIKNLIKKGIFTTTTNSFQNRSKTVKQMLPSVKTSKISLKTFQRISTLSENQQKQKNINARKTYNNLLIGVEALKEKPVLKFEQFDQIINKLDFEKTNQEQRRKIKLQRYSKKKFAFTLRKSSVQTEENSHQ